MKTKLTEMFGIEYPIVQSGMRVQLVWVKEALQKRDRQEPEGCRRMR